MIQSGQTIPTYLSVKLIQQALAKIFVFEREELPYQTPGSKKNNEENPDDNLIYRSGAGRPSPLLILSGFPDSLETLESLLEEVPWIDIKLAISLQGSEAMLKARLEAHPEETARTKIRMEHYVSETMPLLDHFKTQNILQVIVGTGTPEVIYKRLRGSVLNVVYSYLSRLSKEITQSMKTALITWRRWYKSNFKASDMFFDMDAYQREVQLEEHNRVIDQEERLQRKKEKKERKEAELQAFIESEKGQVRGGAQKALALSTALRVFADPHLGDLDRVVEEPLTAGPTAPPGATPKTPQTRGLPTPLSAWSMASPASALSTRSPGTAAYQLSPWIKPNPETPKPETPKPETPIPTPKKVPLSVQYARMKKRQRINQAKYTTERQDNDKEMLLMEEEFERGQGGGFAEANEESVFL